MKGQDFCRIFLFALLNLTCFLLSVVFLCSTYNIQHRSQYICSYISISEKYFNQYQGICALFSFSLFSFLTFIVALIILIKIDKMDIQNDQTKTNNNDDEPKDNSIYNQNINQNNNNNNNRINEKIITFNHSSERGFRNINKNRNNNDQNNHNNQNQKNEENDIVSENKGLMYVLLFSFLTCQLFYFIEVILVSSFYGKSNTLENECKNLKILTTAYRDLMITGIIFLFVYIFFYIFIFILYNEKCKNTSRVAKMTNSLYFEKCSDWIENVCQRMIQCLETCSEEGQNRRIEERIEKKKKDLANLEEYKNNLERFNSNILTTHNINESELEKLHLFKIITN